MNTFVLGLDLGQVNDPTALCVLEKVDAPPPAKPSSQAKQNQQHYQCRLLKRWPLGTPYPTIVDQVSALVAHEPLSDCTLAIDATGVGRPVVDLFRKARLGIRLLPVTITAGQSESVVNGEFHVAKTVLITGVQVLLQSKRIKFADKLPDVPVLIRELQNYQSKITAAAHETFNAREGEHDDIVLAVAVAVWAGERYPVQECAEPSSPNNPGQAARSRRWTLTSYGMTCCARD